MSAAGVRPTPSFLSATDTNALAFRNLQRATDLAVTRRGSVAILFTGSHPGDGTSTVSANHALLTSAAGSRTLLIDANLSRPGLHRRVGTEPAPGLVDVAAGVIALEDAIQTVVVDEIAMPFLPAGSPVRGTVDVLSSQSTADLLTDACRMFDTVVIDSSPVLVVSDASVVAAHPEVDTVVVVAHRQRRKRVNGTVAQLRRVGANVIGLVVNSG